MKNFINLNRINNIDGEFENAITIHIDRIDYFEPYIMTYEKQDTTLITLKDKTIYVSQNYDTVKCLIAEAQQ